MKVLVCGGRNYQGAEKVHEILDALEPAPSLVIHGGASGADWYASQWACRRKVPSMEFPANWAKFGRSAGPRRNRQMLAEGKPDLVVAFPGRTGTADMVNQARIAGVRVIEIDDPDETY